MDILIKIEGEQCHGLFGIKVLLKKMIHILKIILRKVDFR